MKETYILYAYTKPWEHLITLTGAEIKKTKPPASCFWYSPGHGSRPWRAEISKSFRLQEPRGVPAKHQALPKTGNGQWQEKTQQNSYSWAKTSSKASHRNSVSFLVWKIDSEVKCQGHDRQNPRCLNLKHRHLLGSYSEMTFSWKQQRNTGQGAQDNDHKALGKLILSFCKYLFC